MAVRTTVKAKGCWTNGGKRNQVFSSLVQRQRGCSADFQSISIWENRRGLRKFYSRPRRRPRLRPFDFAYEDEDVAPR